MYAPWAFYTGIWALYNPKLPIWPLIGLPDLAGDPADNSNHQQDRQRLVKLALAESSQESKPVFISWQACEGDVDDFKESIDAACSM